MILRSDIRVSFSLKRLNLWYGLLMVILVVFMARLFYLQVIKHDYYRSAALKAQLKEFEIPSERGTIEAYDGNTPIPIVLNEKKYTLFADPKFIKVPEIAAKAIEQAIGGEAKDYESKMRAESRYSILAKKLSKEQKEKIDKLKIPGVGTREAIYRTYPQDGLAAQLLGFVNDEGKGTYGIEEFLDNTLVGKPGRLKAITDASGVPLVANKDNVVIDPQPGSKVTLTIDISMQRQVEDLLKTGLEKAKSKSGSVVIMDPNTGAVKAMANFPTYNPAEFFKVEDASAFANPAVTTSLEVGSIMKPFTVAAALNQGVINENSSYSDPSQVTVDGKTITNIVEDGGAATRTIEDVLIFSLNTGAVHVLKQMGGGEINEKARVAWHDYMTNHYRLGQKTGIEQGFEDPGVIPDPLNGFGLNIQYANTAFGQGMRATPVQMLGAFASLINGGKYYRPHLIDRLTDSAGTVDIKQPEVLSANVISSQTSQTLHKFLEQVASRNNKPAVRSGYSVGSKSGTPQIAKPSGGYYDDRYNGTYLGFVGGDQPQYVIFVLVNEPKIGGYAGARAAAPVFASLTNMLMDNFNVTPKSH